MRMNTPERISSRPLGTDLHDHKAYYLRDIMIKTAKNSEQLGSIKQFIVDVQNHMKSQKGFSNVRIITDVDPF